MVIFLVTIFTAVALVSSKSTYLIDFYIVVACTNRLVRRVLDWMDGVFDPTPISSLLPILIGVMALAAAWTKRQRLPKSYRTGLYLILLGFAYATAVGLVNGPRAIYGLFEYLCPVGIAFYALLFVSNRQTVHRWIKTTIFCAVGVAVYGVFQWVFMPPWDAAWIEWSRMWTSMGHPEPFKTSICSTLDSRGPFAWFMAGSIIFMVASPKIPAYAKFPAIILAGLTIVLSTVRSAWGIVAVGVVVFSLLRGRQGWKKSVIGVLVLVAGLAILKDQMPESERLAARMETMVDVTSDGSFQGRVRIAQHGVWAVLTRPAGFGMGSNGLITSKTTEGGSVVMDNGLLEIMVTLGLPGIVLVGGGLYQILRRAVELLRKTDSALLSIGLAQLASGIAACAFSNWFTLAYAAIMLAPLGGSIGLHCLAEDRRKREFRLQEVSPA